MSQRSLASVPREQIAICAAGGYQRGESFVSIRDAVDRAVAGTWLLREADLGRLLETLPAAPLGASTSVRCLLERSGSCVARLLWEGARRVAVLNYADGVTPGGLFLEGASTQEEALCLGWILVSPDVPFFRDEDLELLEAPFLATVLTAVAPNLGWLAADVSNGREPRSRPDVIPGVFARRTRYVLAAARESGCDALVAGPWGCGAFGNDPEVVASAFRAAVDEQGGAFDRIVFSTWGAAKNREAFERRFGEVRFFRPPRVGPCEGRLRAGPP